MLCLVGFTVVSWGGDFFYSRVVISDSLWMDYPVQCLDVASCCVFPLFCLLIFLRCVVC